MVMDNNRVSDGNEAGKGWSAMWLPLVVLLGAIMLGAVGQICLKSGLAALGSRSAFVVITAMFRNWFVLGGFVAYGISSLLYLFVLSRLDLSYAYPFVAINYVLVTVLAWLILKETVPAVRVVGLAIICLGVLVLATSYRGPSAEPVGTVVESPVDQS